MDDRNFLEKLWDKTRDWVLEHIPLGILLLVCIIGVIYAAHRAFIIS